MNTNLPSSNSPYYRSPLAKHTDLTWHMHATQEVDYQVSVIKDILDPINPTLARTCANHAERNGKTKIKRLVVIDKKVDEIYGDKFRSYFSMKWFTEFGHLNRGDMLTSEQHRCSNEKKKF
ncbi:sedoheptulose 7-phosphate cyclase [Brenneria corticis]|uniref:sedoheptulose 7-phosphate cyclase n=1 Tax=Brenneria corticis TaxID=2173106 RepID=UPI00109DF3B1|nr:sedoheptulose 7-phosphate cyclase [Brenneria sp. CFCC 11842]